MKSTGFHLFDFISYISAWFGCSESFNFRKFFSWKKNAFFCYIVCISKFNMSTENMIACPNIKNNFKCKFHKLELSKLKVIIFFTKKSIDFHLFFSSKGESEWSRPFTYIYFFRVKKRQISAPWFVCLYLIYEARSTTHCTALRKLWHTWGHSFPAGFSFMDMERTSSRKLFSSVKFGIFNNLYPAYSYCNTYCAQNKKSLFFFLVRFHICDELTRSSSTQSWHLLTTYFSKKW